MPYPGLPSRLPSLAIAPISGTEPAEMSSPSILLTTLNSRYHHSSFGLRYLYANLKDLQPRAKLLEFTISQNTREIAETILAHDPRIVGLGVYIWNTSETYEVVSMLKRLKPGLIVVLGGPEVSHEAQSQAICELADFTIQGEADFLFYEFCRAYLEEGKLPPRKWVQGPLPEVAQIASPYSYYSDEDIRHRVIYVEASRGCPYKCEYCLSSLDKSVRNFPIEPFLADLSRLIERGARQFKFIDRTFNLSPSISTRILQFFLDRIELGLFLHFEMVPDRLPPELRELIKKFPKGSLQFEIGIQTWDPEVAKNVSRRQDYAKVAENFRFLAAETGVHTHADLIVGLPGETLETFARGFDAVTSLAPDEVQVGLLKRLKGTPIIRHDQAFGMVYQEHPPFQILQTCTMPFETIQKMTRFANFWDLYANSGNFKRTVTLLRERTVGGGSFFEEFFRFSEFLSARHRAGHGVALLNLVESAWIYLTENLAVEPDLARECLIQDYTGTVKRDVPVFLRTAEQQAGKPKGPRPAETASATPRRQQRHLASKGAVAPLLIAGLLGAGIALAPNSHAKPKPEIELPSVIGGELVEAESPAASPLVRVKGWGNCTGVLIAPELVLTAAHCVKLGAQVPVSQVSVSFGVTASEDAITLGARGLRVHDAFKMENYYRDVPFEKNLGDLALIRLSEPAPAGARPMQLPSAGLRLEPGTTVTVAGFGMTTPKDSSGFGTLYKASQAILNWDYAETELQLDRIGASGVCQGDSGGPAWVELDGTPTLIGITNWGIRPHCEGWVVFAKVPAMLGWIESKSAELLALD